MSIRQLLLLLKKNRSIKKFRFIVLIAKAFPIDELKYNYRFERVRRLDFVNLGIPKLEIPLDV
jgi:hypothetical protein